jgi:hypothetical protein
MIEVAKVIAKGSPPEWLPRYLEYFSDGIEPIKDHRFINSVVGDLSSATDTLLRWLPAWRRLPYGINRSPVYLDDLLAALPRLKGDLERLGRKSPGRKPDIGREVCAAVIIEAFRALHGKVEPRSEKLYEACRMYWDACGGKPIGEINDIDNWRWPVEHALAQDYSWFRDVIEWYRTGEK